MFPPSPGLQSLVDRCSRKGAMDRKMCFVGKTIVRRARGWKSAEQPHSANEAVMLLYVMRGQRSDELSSSSRLPLLPPAMGSPHRRYSLRHLYQMMVPIQTSLFAASNLPEGLLYQPDFLTEPEESELIHTFRALPFSNFDFHGYTARRRV